MVLSETARTKVERPTRGHMGHVRRWTDLRIGQSVWLRGTRGRGKRYQTTVAGLLEANLDGPGLIDDKGEQRRSFYWEIVRAPRAVKEAPKKRFAPARPGLPELVVTPMQFAVAQLFVAGLTMDESADHLGITRSTTSVHLRELRKRYLRAGRPVPDRTSLAAEFEREIPAIAFRGRLVSPAR